MYYYLYINVNNNFIVPTEMPGARTDILRRLADRRRTVPTSGRTRPTAGPSTTGCTTVTGRRLVACTKAAAAVGPQRTQTHCRRWPRPASSTISRRLNSCTTNRNINSIISCSIDHLLIWLRRRRRRPGPWNSPRRRSSITNSLLRWRPWHNICRPYPYKIQCHPPSFDLLRPLDCRPPPRQVAVWFCDITNNRPE